MMLADGVGRMADGVSRIATAAQIEAYVKTMRAAGLPVGLSASLDQDGFGFPCDDLVLLGLIRAIATKTVLCATPPLSRFIV